MEGGKGGSDEGGAVRGLGGLVVGAVVVAWMCPVGLGGGGDGGRAGQGSIMW